jgi:hypothetical protein
MFYSLSYSSNNFIGNGDTQVHCLFNLDIQMAFTKTKFPIINDVLKFDLNKKAKITNCLSQRGIASGGLLIDEKIKNILTTSYKLIEHKFYDAEIVGKKVDAKYFWFQCDEDLTNEIDYSNSSFYETMYSCEEGEIKLESFEHYKTLKEEKGIFWGVVVNKIILKPNSKLREYDLFRIFPFENVICISEKLKMKFENEKITGVEIKNYDNIHFL